MNEDIYISPAMKFPSLLGGLLVFGFSILRADAKIEIKNGDFESGTANWNLFVPPASAGAGCGFSVETTSAHSGQKAARLSATGKARFGVHYYEPTPIPVQKGHRYRMTVWAKAGEGFTIDSGTPGVVLRATLFDRQMKDAPGGHFVIGLGGVHRGDANQLTSVSLPTSWTKIESIVEIPEGTSYMVPFVFLWKASGTLWIDDLSVTEVDSSGTPVS